MLKSMHKEGDILIEYKLVRSDRKTVSIQVNENGDVTVRIPKRYPEYKVKNFVDENLDWILATQETQRVNNNKKLKLSDEQIIKLKKLAKKIIVEKVEYYSMIMSVKPTGVKITSAQKRFGSCNGKNSLCFSYILMLYPEDAIDYVVVHELAHIRHHNHSEAFYDFISRFMPDYKQREKLLKTEQKLPDFS